MFLFGGLCWSHKNLYDLHGFHGYKKPKTIGCWYGYKKNILMVSVVGMVTKKTFDGFGCWYGYKTKFWWFRLLVWLQNKFLMVSVVGMVTKQIFDGYGSWYGYHKHVIFGFQKPSMVPKNRSSLTLCCLFLQNNFSSQYGSFA